MLLRPADPQAVAQALIGRDDCLAAAWLTESLGCPSPRLAGWRREGRIFALPLPQHGGAYDCLYPIWQFADGQPRPRLDYLIEVAARRGLSELDLYLALTKVPGLAVKGEPAYLALARGEIDRPYAVIAAARPLPEAA